LIKIGNYDFIKEEALKATTPSNEDDKERFVTFLINKGLEDCQTLIEGLSESKTQFYNTPIGAFQSLNISEYFEPLFFIYESVIPLMLQGNYEKLYELAVDGEDKEDFIRDSRNARRKLIKDLESKYGHLFE
jgi:hypothetical protein